MKQRMRKLTRRQSGWTLIELGVVLIIIALGIAGVLALFQSSSAQANTNAMLQDVTAIRSSTQGLYTGQGGYGTASLNATLYTANKIPTDMTYSGGTITTRLGGTLTVTGNTANFEIAITNVPTDVCTNLLTMSSTGWASVQVGTATPITAFPVSPATATSASNCGAAAPHTITWTTLN